MRPFPENNGKTMEKPTTKQSDRNVYRKVACSLNDSHKKKPDNNK